MSWEIYIAGNEKSLTYRTIYGMSNRHNKIRIGVKLSKGNDTKL